MLVSRGIFFHQYTLLILRGFAQSQAKILCCYNGTRSLCFSSALRVLRSPETIKLTDVRQFSISLLYQL